MGRPPATPRWLRAPGCFATLAACALAARVAVCAPAAPAAAPSAAPSAAAATAAPAATPAASLRAQYATLAERLEHSPFHQRLVLESVETPHGLQGDIYALVDYPFATVSGTFTVAARWCDALILHLNVKYCRATLRDRRPVLSVALGRKYDQPLSDAFRLDFAYTLAASAADYMEVHLDAREGPVGTQDYRIAFAAVAIEGGRTFMHLRYSYASGVKGRIAIATFLATAGRDKVGFTTTGATGGGNAQFIGGARGMAERNTMRYYLAIDALLGALAKPPAQRFELSLERWFAATEHYARQLHEVDKDAYLAMKRREYLRQQAPR